MTTICITEELKNRDRQTDNKYDLYNYYISYISTLRLDIQDHEPYYNKVRESLAYK